MRSEEPRQQETPADRRVTLVLSGALLDSYLKHAGPRARADIGKWGEVSGRQAQPTPG